MRSSTNIRNIAIIVVLALGVDLLKGGQAAARTALQAISLAFLALMVFIASKLYREHRTTIYSVGTRHRAIVYAALGGIVLLLTANSRMLATGGGTVAWIVLLAGCVYAIYSVVRSARQY